MNADKLYNYFSLLSERIVEATGFLGRFVEPLHPLSIYVSPFGHDLAIEIDISLRRVFEQSS